MSKYHPFKQWERDVADALGGQRILRGGDFEQSAPDVFLPDLPWLKIDCKHTRGKFRHHALLLEIATKYCAENPDSLEVYIPQRTPVPVLATKQRGEGTGNITIPLEHYAELLNAFRAMQREREGAA